MALQLRIVRKLGVGINVLYQDREGDYKAYPSKKLTSFKPFWLADLRVQWSEKNYKLFVDANNVFDTTYYDLGNLVQPGLWLKAGVQISLNL